MPVHVEPKLIAGNSNPALAKSVARRMSLHRGVAVELVRARVERFNDQEIFVEVFENVRGEDMFIIQSTSKPANDTLMELCIMTDALRRSSAHRITAVIPYFGYARQDRRAKARTPISAKLVANLLTTAGVDRVLTLDLHAAQIQGFFDIPWTTSTPRRSSPSTSSTLQRRHQGHDRRLPRRGRRGPRARARAAHRLQPRHRRQAPPKPGEVGEMTVIGDVKDQICVIVDDIVDTPERSPRPPRPCARPARGGPRLHHPRRPVRARRGAITNSMLKSLVITDSIEPSEDVRAAPRSASSPPRRCSRRRS
jgi:ribose-phosphate pyrophosphokinase